MAARLWGQDARWPRACAEKSRQQATKALITRSILCVQEEIMFACQPELNCARLVFTPMQPDEAFVLCG